MAKAIYTLIGEKYYQINQKTNIPDTTNFDRPGISSSVVLDAGNSRLTQTVTINTLASRDVKSNKENAEIMEAYLKEKGITDIPVVPNTYVIYVDYSIYENKREIDHSCVIKPLFPEDVIYPLGVATNNETVYLRVKNLKQVLEFRTRVPVPHGISRTKSNREAYTLRINNIIIYLDTYGDRKPNESTYENPYGGNSYTVYGKLDTMIPVYSTDGEGYDFDPTTVSFIPRVVTLDIHIDLANLIVIYNDKEIAEIIQDNLKEKYQYDGTISTGTESADEGTLIPNAETRPAADGSEEPNRDGWYDYYERCTATNPNRLLVVENELSDAHYDEKTMVRQENVIKDIPDIEIGEYVLYCEAVESYL